MKISQSPLASVNFPSESQRTPQPAPLPTDRRTPNGTANPKQAKRGNLFLDEQMRVYCGYPESRESDNAGSKLKCMGKTIQSGSSKNQNYLIKAP